MSRSLPATLDPLPGLVGKPTRSQLQCWSRPGCYGSLVLCKASSTPLGLALCMLHVRPLFSSCVDLVAATLRPGRRHNKLPGILSTFHVSILQVNCPFTSPFWSRHQRARFCFFDDVYDATLNPQQTSNAGVHRKPHKRAAVWGRRAELCLAADPCCKRPTRNGTPRDGRSHGRTTTFNRWLECASLYLAPGDRPTSKMVVKLHLGSSSYMEQRNDELVHSAIQPHGATTTTTGSPAQRGPGGSTSVAIHNHRPHDA